ncbi:MAG: hypothetical protein JXA21_14345 [Anaerolineae bacterium]|nr:hypothetical protein [Anaerolineae bacterium]
MNNAYNFLDVFPPSPKKDVMALLEKQSRSVLAGMTSETLEADERF